MRDFAIPGQYIVDADVTGEGLIDYKTERKSLAVGVRDSDNHAPDINGIFDTGAQSVCFKIGYPARFGFTKIGRASVSGANGTAEADVWRGHFILQMFAKKYYQPTLIECKNITIWETNLPKSVDVLIGQPIIKLFDFHVWAGFKGVTLEKPKVS